MLSSWLPNWLAGEAPQTETPIQSAIETQVNPQIEIAVDAPVLNDIQDLESPVLIDIQPSPVVYKPQSPVVVESSTPVIEDSTHVVEDSTPVVEDSTPVIEIPQSVATPTNPMSVFSHDGIVYTSMPKIESEEQCYFQKNSPKSDEITVLPVLPIQIQSPEPNQQVNDPKSLNLPISDSPAGQTPQSSWIPPSPTLASSSPSPSGDSNRISSPKASTPSTSFRDPMFYVKYPFAPKNATTTMTFKATPVTSKHDITPIIEDLISEIDSMIATTQTDSQTQTHHLMSLGSSYRKYNISREDRDNDLELVSSCLDAMGIVGTDFCQQMEKYQCLMAGSFPLQCLFGEYYADSDINIFCSSAREYYAFSSWLSHQYAVEGKWKSMKIPFLTMSKTYEINPNTAVNVILVASDNLKEYLKYTTDMSFCQTSFDGTKLDYSDLTLRKVGTIQNIEMPLASVVRRIQKYQSRGYLIIDAEQFIDAYYRIHSGKWE
jgi:hypothetical protein